jgi:hypothetical protein
MRSPTILHYLTIVLNSIILFTLLLIQFIEITCTIISFYLVSIAHSSIDHRIAYFNFKFFILLSRLSSAAAPSGHVLNAWTARIFLEKNERGNSATPLEL